MDSKEECNNTELLCVRPENTAKHDKGTDKQDCKKYCSVHKHVKNIPMPIKRATVFILCVLLLVSTPAGIGSFIKTIVESADTSAFIISLESGAHGEASMHPSDFLAYVTANKLISGIVSSINIDYNNTDQSSNNANNNNGQNGSDISVLDIPINQRSKKS